MRAFCNRMTAARAALPRAICLTAALLIGTCLPALPRAAAEDTAIGTVARLHPAVRAETLTERRDLEAEAPVHAGERLRTDPSGRASIRLDDGSVLTLGEAAVVSLDSLIYDPDTGVGAATLTVMHGAFRMVSGALGKQGSMRVETPIATIGIRGTDFWGYQDGRALSVVLLDDGLVSIETAGGSIALDEPGDGIVITDPEAPMPDTPARWDANRIARNIVTVAFPGE
ncbi:FecR domain-containing protein [Marivibrio halodurans]|uniref:FecR domain-containing protein n=1 Tax=Marivibrio halodurans TaxID=2039722 RepID=A0A8J7SKQ3_9PROT|nr:FecR domain-containing protein [Marivibrio halodurans]MBP5856353.1 FecR domain-containing protein [Marivibrio halodurans]